MPYYTGTGYASEVFSYFKRTSFPSISSDLLYLQLFIVSFFFFPLLSVSSHAVSLQGNINSAIDTKKHPINAIKWVTLGRVASYKNHNKLDSRAQCGPSTHCIVSKHPIHDPVKYEC